MIKINKTLRKDLLKYLGYKLDLRNPKTKNFINNENGLEKLQNELLLNREYKKKYNLRRAQKKFQDKKREQKKEIKNSMLEITKPNKIYEVIKPIKTNFFNIPVDIRNIIWDKVKKEKNEMKYYKILIEDFFYKNFSHLFTNWHYDNDTNYKEQTNNKNIEYMYNIIREYQIKGKDLSYLFREDNYKDKFLNEYNFLRIYNKFFNNRQEEYKEIQDFLNGDGAEFNEIDYNEIYIFYLYEQLYISLKKIDKGIKKNI
jgi:hypothetical protein